MIRRRPRRATQPLLPGLVVPPPPLPAPFRGPDPQRAQREARSTSTLAALIRNLATGTRAVDAEATR